MGSRSLDRVIVYLPKEWLPRCNISLAAMTTDDIPSDMTIISNQMNGRNSTIWLDQFRRKPLGANSTPSPYQVYLDSNLQVTAGELANIWLPLWPVNDADR